MKSQATKPTHHKHLSAEKMETTKFEVQITTPPPKQTMSSSNSISSPNNPHSSPSYLQQKHSCSLQSDKALENNFSKEIPHPFILPKIDFISVSQFMTNRCRKPMGENFFSQNPKKWETRLWYRLKIQLDSQFIPQKLVHGGGNPQFYKHCTGPLTIQCETPNKIPPTPRGLSRCRILKDILSQVPILKRQQFKTMEHYDLQALPFWQKADIK